MQYFPRVEGYDTYRSNRGVTAYSFFCLRCIVKADVYFIH